MNPGTRSALGLGVAIFITGGAVGAASFRPGTGGSSLAVRDAGGWTTWWRSAVAPAVWSEDAPLARRVVWRAGAAGMEWGELQLTGSSEAWRTRVIVVRLDPHAVRLSLAPAFTQNASWSIASGDSAAVLAFNAGQFLGRLPWGWVVAEGKEFLTPESAPLAGAVIVDASGGLRIVQPDSVAAERERGTAREAFQSYPMLLMHGAVPAALRIPGLGVDLTHRDARVALGTLDDGLVIIALTRFDALGSSLGRIPFGLTSPEMAAVMGGLGARDALLLDGGISGQLMLRSSDGSVHRWPGIRSVPLGLVARSK